MVTITSIDVEFAVCRNLVTIKLPNHVLFRVINWAFENNIIAISSRLVNKFVHNSRLNFVDCQHSRADDFFAVFIDSYFIFSFHFLLCGGNRYRVAIFAVTWWFSEARKTFTVESPVVVQFWIIAKSSEFERLVQVDFDIRQLSVDLGRGVGSWRWRRRGCSRYYRGFNKRYEVLKICGIKIIRNWLISVK